MIYVPYNRVYISITKRGVRGWGAISHRSVGASVIFGCVCVVCLIVDDVYQWIWKSGQGVKWCRDWEWSCAVGMF